MSDTSYYAQPPLTAAVQPFTPRPWGLGEIASPINPETLIQVKKSSAKPAPKPTASDGGSSSYYCIQLPEWLIDSIVAEKAVQVEDIIEVVFGRNFDYGNAFKSLVRAYGREHGGGKAGNTVDYDMNKVIYSANRIKEIHARKEEI